MSSYVYQPYTFSLQGNAIYIFCSFSYCIVCLFDNQFIGVLCFFLYILNSNPLLVI